MNYINFFFGALNISYLRIFTLEIILNYFSFRDCIQLFLSSIYIVFTQFIFIAKVNCYNLEQRGTQNESHLFWPNEAHIFLEDDYHTLDRGPKHVGFSDIPYFRRRVQLLFNLFDMPDSTYMLNRT